MTEPKDALTRDLKRRSVIKAAAWTAPVVAAAAVVPMAAASEPVVEATSVGATTTSPLTGNVGTIRPFGIDPNGDDGFFPAGQTFTLRSSDLDFNSIITSITGGSISESGTGVWIITPAPGVTNVTIKFTSSAAGSYELTSNGPASPNTSWDGSVVAR